MVGICSAGPCLKNTPWSIPNTFTLSSSTPSTSVNNNKFAEPMDFAVCQIPFQQR